ncbi:maleylpyruvate isomerase family mycothiol-dependent enzyme [Georgenia sp. Z1491]|uniref:maleylpyruvate isomerase family mycothiol-dependent enzyme n=1 Tax=Georgenia sp. Z1491 TaxID=3416707 RepID=UPI003CE7DD02
MTTPYDEAALQELRERQGSGARYDAEEAPKQELGWARSGTAYFLRKLRELTDDELDGPSLLGWTRRELIAHVGYNARALTRLTEWARTGVETPMYAPGQRDAEIELGATLPPVALRHLIDHSAVHLNVEWRDLTDEQWDHEVVTAQGRTVPVRETAWMRTREVWIHAVDLDNHGSYRDFPPELLDRLSGDVLAVWDRKGTTPDVVLDPTDRPGQTVVGAGGRRVAGAQADLVRWVTGRGALRLDAEGDQVPELPPWL